MEKSSNHPEPVEEAPPADSIFVLPWLLGHAVGLVIAAGLTIWLAGQYDWQSQTWLGEGLSLAQRWDNFLAAVGGAPATVKLLVFAIYVSICTTFTPLPTGGIVAALATREAALAAGIGGPLWVEAAATTLIIALAGAAASTVANLTDYHLLTWMLRSDRIGKVRRTAIYRGAVIWFQRNPFFLLVVFNVMPIPIDLVRMLATTWRYPRGPFAVANFIGRFIRYGVIAFVTYWWNLGWIAVVSLLGFAIALGLVKLGLTLVRKSRPANHSDPEVSDG
ncbi:MAG: hypothetical protein ACLFUJ_06455 [Phycisphaerae bacterium]